MKHRGRLAALMAMILWLACGYARVGADAPPSLIALDSAANAGDSAAMYRMARVYEQGYHPYVERDSLLAYDLYLRSANLGYAPSQSIMGYVCYNPASPDRDVAKAIEWTEKAAMQGDAKAANNLGWMLVEGEGVVHDYKKAAYWFEKGADAGLPVAQAQLADLYREGKGVECDTLRAIKLYEDAIGAGLADAQNKLLNMMMPRWLDLADSAALARARRYLEMGAPGIAVNLLKVKSLSQNPEALALLGFAYSRGEGVEYNHALSTEYFFRAAAAGNAPAQFVIGELLEVFPDALSEMDTDMEITDVMLVPAYWYAKAAEGGITDAASAIRSMRKGGYGEI